LTEVLIFLTFTAEFDHEHSASRRVDPEDSSSAMAGELSDAAG
jgi:hypothetical protein